MNICNKSKKIGSRFILILLCCGLCLNIIRYDYERAYAAAGVVEAESAAAVPLVWEVVESILVALGIGTAAYWSTADSDTKSSVLSGIRDDLKEVGYLMEDIQTWPDELQEMTSAAGAYIKTSVVDGYNYISDSILSVFYNFAAQNDMLGGVSSGAVSLPSSGISSGVHSDFSVDTSAFISVLENSPTSSSFFSVSRRNAIVSLCRSFPEFCIMIYGALNRDCYVYFIPLTTMQSYYFGAFSRYSYGSDGASDGIFYNSFSTPVQFAYIVSLSGNSSLVSGTTFLPNSRFNYGRMWYKSYYDVAASNYGLTSVSGCDIPIGENGQVSENDGAIDYPWQTGAEKIIDGEASHPVSIPADVAADVITWDPAIEETPAVALPGVSDAVDNVLSPDTTQTDTQEGTLDLPTTIPDTPAINPSMPAFMLPSWIKDRFPFCIPFDLKRAADQFASAGSEPPSFSTSLKYGKNAEYTWNFSTDLSRFNGLMSVFRTGELIIFLIGLMLMTRAILRS